MDLCENNVFFSSYCYHLKSMLKHLCMFVGISTSGASIKCLVSG